MFHQQIIAYGKHVIVTETNAWTVAIIVECLISCEKRGDIQMTLQLSECLSVTNICEQNTFARCDFIGMQHNSHSGKVSL